MTIMMMVMAMAMMILMTILVMMMMMMMMMMMTEISSPSPPLRLFRELPEIRIRASLSAGTATGGSSKSNPSMSKSFWGSSLAMPTARPARRAGRERVLPKQP